MACRYPVFLRLLSLILVSVALPALAAPPAAPSGLAAFLTKTSQNAGFPHTYAFLWNDNSSDETGFEVGYRFGTFGSFQTLISGVAANTTGQVLNLEALPNGTTIQFVVRAYKGSPTPSEYSTFSNVATVTVPATTFNPPTGVTGTPNGDGTIKVTWTDASTSEDGVELWYTEQPGGTPTKLTDVFFYQTQLINISQLPPGIGYKFKLRAYREGTTRTYTAFSAESAIALPGAPATPTGLTATGAGSTAVNLKWTDNSSVESSYEVMSRPKGTTGTFISLGTTSANSNAATVPNLNPVAPVEFVVRARTDYGTPAVPVFSANSNIAAQPVTFAAPTNVTGTPMSESTILLSWTDVSASEDGVEVWYALEGGTFSKLGDNLFSQPSQLTMTQLAPGVGYRFKVRAYREGTPRTFTPFSATSPTLMSNPPAAPTGLTASNVQATSLTLSWTDNSQVETSYEILTRPTGGGAFTVRQIATANATSADVVNLTPGASLDFAVRARADYVAPVLSANSNVITRQMRDVITSPHYAQVLVGQPFSYTLTTTNGSPRVSQNISGLPSGLMFDSNTMMVSGTPNNAGVTLATMSATFADGSTHSPGLSIRVLNPPVVASPIPAKTLSTGNPLAVPLGGAFSDPEATSAVKVTTTLGAMHFILFDNATPQTVLNFMNYVNVGAYSNNTFHRSIPGFVVQGGSFKPSAAPNNFTSAPRFSPVVNEPGISSIRGTIAMAKLPGDPNSATNDFFVNLENNGAILDTQNSGFTVFGRVAGNGMAVADAIAARPTGSYVVKLDGADHDFHDWPLDSPDALAGMDNSKVVGITNVAPASIFSYAVTSNTNAGAVTAGVSGNNLTLTPVAPGTANITVRATTLDGNSVSQTFAVTTSSSAATLANLVSSSGALSPAFASATTAYTATVPNTTASLTLTPTVTQAQATVTINGVSAVSGTAGSAIPLLVGSNVITVLVTAADGVSTKSYTFTVNRTASAPVVSTLNATGVGATGATLNGTIDPKSSSTAASFDYGLTTGYGGNIVAAPSPVTGNTSTATVATLSGLTPGATYHYRTRGVNSAGTTLGVDKTFTTQSAVTNLANLVVSAGALTPVFSSATTTYAMTVPGGTAALTVTPTASQALAIVRVNGIAVPSGKPSGAIALSPGPNAIPILVTAQDGLTTKNYTLTVTRALPPVATTLAATSIRATGATFNGTVNAGGASTAVTFEYGTTTAYGSSVTAAPSPVTGTSTTAASATLATLLPSTDYHYRIKTVSVGGTVTGADATFRTPSNVTTLSSLNLSTGALSPVFASATTSYSQNVLNGTTSLTVTPTLSNPNATVTVNSAIVASGNLSGPIALSPGPNTIAVQVTAQDGVTVKTYTVNVTRQASPVATLAGLSLSSGTLSPAFTSATTAYTATVPNTTDTLQLTPTLTSNLATVTVNGAPVPSGSPSGAINLNAGSNVITVVGTAEDKITKKTYTVTVTRTAALATVVTAAATGVTTTNAVLNGTINAKGGATTATFDYGTTLAYGSSKAATPSPVNGSSTTAVSATLTGLTPGATYHFRLRGVNLAGTALGTDATFTTPSNVATLSSLVLSSGALSPVFASATTNYSQTVPNATASVTVKPTASHAAAALLLNGNPIASGATSGAIALNTGPNVITVQSTAQDGVTARTYTITVTRRALPVTTTLAAGNLKTTGATLNATVNASGLSTATSFEYGLTSGYGSTAAAVPATVTGSANTAVSATISGLVAGTTYHYRVKGTNSGGTNTGLNTTFTTPSAKLSGLELSAGTLTPAFSSNTTAYTAAVPYSAGFVTVTPTATDTATIKVNGTTVASGAASAPIPLVPGSNTINTVLTSQDGAATKTYTVIVTRAEPVSGNLDLAFNGTGKTTTSIGGTQFGGGNDIANCVAVQTDGKIVVAGSANDNGQPLFAVARYLPGGNPDTSFNGTGWVTTDLGGYNYAYAMTLQNDGKIVVVGEAQGSVALARYNTDGSLDTTFGGFGKVLVSETGFKSGRGVVVQSSGKIVVAVEYADSNNRHWIGLLRCNTNGTLDTDFGGTGTGMIIVPTATGHWFDSYARSVALQSDEKIIVAGYGVEQFVSGQTNDIEVTRFNANGTWDTSFGGGVVRTDFGSTDDKALGVAVQADDSVVVAGASSGNFVLARYNTLGALDTNFNGTGTATADFGGGSDSASSVAIQSNGKIVAAGWTNNGGNYDFALARFTAGGVPDPALNGTGQLTAPIGSGADFGTGLALQRDGKIIVAGYAENGSNADFAVARFHGDPRFAVLTTAATGVTPTGATMNGLVAPNGLSTTVSFDYGLTTAFGTNVAATPTPLNGSLVTATSKVLTGLLPGTTYHYRAKGINSGGTATGATATFTTPSNVASLSGLTLSGVTLSPIFSSATTTYNSTVPAGTTSLTVTPTATHAKATVTVNSVIAASGSAGGPIALSPGPNTIAVQVTAQDGVTLKTYTVNVTRLSAPVATTLLPTNLTAVGAKLNGTLNALNSGSTTASFVYGPTTAYGSSIAATPASVTGSATTAVSATLAGLTPGATYHYQVKGVSANGTGLGADMTFTTPSNVATLADIELNAGNLSPAFASATTIYTVAVPNATASITLNPIRSHSAATVNVNSVPVASGNASAPINLNVGSNVITLLVTAQDGTTKKTYTVTVTRASALASLTTQAATGVGTTGATLRGTVNSANGSSTAVSFDYGLTTSYGSSVTATPTPVTGTASTNVSATLAGLTPNKTYHYRVKGVNVAGTTLNAGDMTFTTVSNTATLSGLALSAPPLSPALSPVFSSATTTYSSTVPAATTFLTVTPTLADAKATVTVNSVFVASGSASGAIDLSPGLNVIAVQVTAQDGVTLKTYTVNVTRLAVPVATTLAATNLTAVGAKLNGTLNALNSSTAVSFVYGPTTSYGSSITATPTPVTGSTATAVSATLAGLTPGATYHYQVKGVSAGGTSLGADATFTTPSNVATLAGLTPGSGTLSPTFASATTAYTATVGNATESITLTPTLGNSSAIVTVNGAPVASGNASGAINLNIGSNLITLLVTAQDGTTKKTYAVTVTRTGLAPTMTTLAAAGVSATNATLNGTATANHAGTTVTFDYGPTAAYGTSIAATPSSLSGSASTPVSATLNGLTPGTTYHYRVKGVNVAGTTPGTNLTFSTPGNVATLSGLVLSTGALSPAFAGASTVYSQTVPNTTTSLTVKPTATSAAATLLLNGAPIGSGSTSGAIALSPGPNTITVLVTAQDGVTTTIYTVTVNRTTPAPTVVTQQADNVSATGATVHGTVNAQGTSTNATFNYGLTTAYGSSAVAAESPVNGSGVTPVTVALAGLQSGKTYHYRLSALNAGGLSSGLDATFTTPSNVTTLSGLALSTGALTPAFTSATTSYAHTVPNATTSLTVTPTATHPEATLLLNGAPIGSGSTSAAIALSPGPNTLTVQITAQDGIATGTYTINVTRTTPVPTVATLPADNVTTTGATLHGTVNAEGTSTTAGFEYGLTSAYGSSVTAMESPLNGGSATPVTAALTGLQSGTTYHYRVTGLNVGGPGNGLDATFTTISTTATLSGLAFSTGSPSPEFASATTSYTMSVPDATTSITVTPTATSAAATLLLNGAAIASGSTSNAIPLSTGLNVITVQVTAQDNVTSLTYTVNVTRTVPAPAVITQAADQVGQTGATLHGTVNAQGASTTVSFEYGLTTAYGSSIAAAESPVNGTSATPVTTAPTGLLHGRTYHYRVTATNEGGPSDGLDMTFTTLHADVLATLTPASTSSTSATPVVLHVTGLVPGEPVIVDRFVDSDADGTVDPDEFLAGTFAVTDGQVTSIAGVRNTNMPGDEDGAADGQASIHINPSLGSELGRVAGAQLVRISSPTAAFPPLLRPLTVTQLVEPQSISGTVTDGTNPVPHASVVLLDAANNTGFVRGVVADAAGQFTLNAPAGAYTIFAVRSGYVGTFQSVTLGAGNPLTQDLELSPATTSIAGKIADAGTDSGLGGVQLFAQTQGGRVAVLSSHADGTYLAPVTADQWQIKASDASLSQLGHLGLDGESDTTADTTSAAATGVNISLPIVTALIHGTVADSIANPLPGIWLEAGNSSHLYRSVATTDASGHYVLGATTGSWLAGIPGDSPGLAGYVIPTEQSVIFTGAQATQTDFTLIATATQISGHVKDANNQAVSGVRVSGNSAVAGIVYSISAITDSAGSYSLPVFLADWTVGVSSADLLAQGYQAPADQYVLVDTGPVTVDFNTGLSSNANLAGLVLSSGTLSPAFASATTDYTATVGNATGSLTVTPTTSHSGATVTVDSVPVTSGNASGAILLNEGANVIPIAVTAQNGTSTTNYVLTVTREAPMAPSPGGDEPAPGNGPAASMGAGITAPAAGSGAIKARLTGPVANGGVLPDANVSFTWDAGVGASEYWLSIGTTVAGTDLHDGSQDGGQARTIDNLPGNGSEIHVTLKSWINGAWLANHYVFRAADTTSKAVLSAPANESKLGAAAATFTWNAVEGADEYWLSIGSVEGGADVYDASQGTALNRTVSLPADGRELFVSLRTRVEEAWASSDTTLFAFGSGAPAAAQITSPANHSALSGATVTFTWDAGSGASEYWLGVGSNTDAMDLFSASQGTGQSATLTLPADGGPLYVTLFSRIDGVWRPIQYLYEAALPK